MVRSRLADILKVLILITFTLTTAMTSTPKSSRGEGFKASTPLYERQVRYDPKTIQEVIDLYYTGDFNSCYEKGINSFWKYPDSTTTLIFGLVCASELGELENVAKDVEDQLFNSQVDPQLAHTFLGFVSLMEYVNTAREEYLRDAKEEFLEAISGPEKYASSLTGLGITYYLNNLDLKALWNLERSYRLLPDDPITTEYLAKTYMKFSKERKALKVLSSMLDKYLYPDGYFLYGVILFNDGRYEEALKAFDKCQELDKGNVNVKITCLVRASDTAVKLGLKEKAIRYLELASKLDPGNSWIKHKLKKLTGEKSEKK